MIIYHSREALTARLAALIHVGRLGAEVDPAAAWSAIDVEDAHGAEGLWLAGHGAWSSRDGSSADGAQAWPSGQTIPVYAAGRLSRPDVVERAFNGTADLFEVESRSYKLVAVGPSHGWGDLVHLGLRRLGLAGWARRLELRLLATRWPGCLAAVKRVR